ncbi:DEAD/DEAH box helicase [Flavonifractor sp. DFI.6.63]|uniref:SNF2-related protein n=1 Tax=Flavonifractor sp. DFI.6.63 TaxID=2963704 RepID=UPI00210E2445|nr:DEAD/DEAH box helicase [Flavonifractor sp. DFI.6.63]MCQ5028689.1 DEAD/DEAH box helicase [Flavonifractor sp. DFI.6.63]
MKFEPHPYQAYAIGRVVSDPFVALFLEPGLGKTVITLTAIKELKFNRWSVSRPLVVAPKKVAEATWASEAAKWDHLRELKVIPILGTEKQRVNALFTPGDIWVINRENLPWLADYCRNNWPFDMVVLDESTSFKNSRAKRFLALKRVRQRITRMVELTGTPSPNGMEDLYAQIYLLDGGARLGRTLTSFRENFMSQDRAHPGQQYRTYSLLPGADQRIRDAISDICISMKAEDYLTLPDYIEDIVPVALDAAAKKSYQKLEREMLLQVDTETVTAGTAATLNGKLLQLCGGAVYANDGGVAEVHTCKIDAFLELIEQLNGEHALVFFWYKHERERIIQALAGRGLRVRTYEGPDDEQAWNAGEVDVLLAHPVSCGYGLNLQAGGHHSIWYTLPNWALEIFQQANKRLHRQGQSHPVISHLLIVQGGVDEDVLASLQSKGDGQEALMQALKARIEKARRAA